MPFFAIYKYYFNILGTDFRKKRVLIYLKMLNCYGIAKNGYRCLVASEQCVFYAQGSGFAHFLMLKKHYIKKE